MKVRPFRYARTVLVALGVATGLVGCGGGGGGGGSSSVAVGDDIVFTLRWEGPPDLDLSVVTPSGSRVSFSNPSSGGCSLDGDEGDEPGQLDETITCRNVTGGTYSAFADNLDSGAVSATLEITSGGVEIESQSVRIPGGDTAGPYRVDVESETPPPPAAGIEGAWFEDRARLRSSDCSRDLDDLLDDFLPFAQGTVIVERSGDSVTISDAEETVTAFGGVQGTVVNADTTVSDSAGGCAIEAGVNLTVDLGRSPATAVYNLDWEFSGCPGFSDCTQVLETRWRR